MKKDKIFHGDNLADILREISDLNAMSTGYNTRDVLIALIHMLQALEDKVDHRSDEDCDNLYGYFPHCGSKGVSRERRPNGSDKCINGHVYPSSAAKAPKKGD